MLNGFAMCGQHDIIMDNGFAMCGQYDMISKCLMTLLCVANMIS